MLRSIGKQSGESVESAWKKKSQAMVGKICGTGKKPERYQKKKQIWILLKKGTVSGNGISWAIYQRDDDILYTSSAPCSGQVTMATPHHPVFLQAGCPSCRSTNSIIALKWTYKVSRHLKTPITAKYSQSKLNWNCFYLWPCVRLCLSVCHKSVFY